MPDIKFLTDLAGKIAKQASELLLEGDNKQYRAVEYDFEHDVKIHADRKLEAFIIEKLINETSFPVLSEESGIIEKVEQDTKYIWIVDPLDGSLNFSKSIPICCISIALWKGNKPVSGVVYDFNRDEMFSGIVGECAWLNNKKISVSDITEKKNAVLCTGFPVSTDFSPKPLLNFVEDIRKYKKIRLLGSAALSLAYVACGRADVYWENDIKIWDVAAGIALVKAAAGVAKYSPTGKENIFRVKASNRRIAEFVI